MVSGQNRRGSSTRRCGTRFHGLQVLARCLTHCEQTPSRLTCHTTGWGGEMLPTTSRLADEILGHPRTVHIDRGECLNSQTCWVMRRSEYSDILNPEHHQYDHMNTAVTLFFGRALSTTSLPCLDIRDASACGARFSTVFAGRTLSE